MTVLTGRISKQAWMVAPETVRVMQALQTDGGDARFVGGCVRNALVNRRVMDIDIATPLTPDQVIDRLTAAKIAHAPTGLQHGTVTAIADGHPFEITTLRRDVNPRGRHADVVFTDDWQTDASRRDFTINALYATLDGDVYDYFGGIEDLRRGRVVFVGDPERRIREDVLRILRYFRFFAHFGQGAPDVAALAACTALADHLPRLSAERVRQEILKLMESPRAAEVWRIMLVGRVVTHVLPEATNVDALDRLVTLENIYHCPHFPLRRLACVLDVTVDGLMRVVQSLRLSNEQGSQLLAMFEPAAEVSLTMDMPSLRRLVYVCGNDTARSLLLLSAARSGQEGKLFDLYGAATRFRPPRFPLQGEDVLALGHAQGPVVGRILDEIESWWVAQDFLPGRTACLEKLKTDFPAVV